MLRVVSLSAFAVAAMLAQAHAQPAGNCAERAERVIVNVRADMRTGNVGREVGGRLVAELTEAAAHCRAGRAAQGEAILRRIATTFNYR
jgi:hypothetical protein